GTWSANRNGDSMKSDANLAQPATSRPATPPPGTRYAPGQVEPGPVCIAGMHRSGTSMVAMLMHRCGLYLGEERDLMAASQDNPDGFWENTKFVELNDLILHELGGGWDCPPAVRGEWEAVLARLRGSAEQVLQEFADRSPWGW